MSKLIDKDKAEVRNERETLEGLLILIDAYADAPTMADAVATRRNIVNALIKALPYEMPTRVALDDATQLDLHNRLGGKPEKATFNSSKTTDWSAT